MEKNAQINPYPKYKYLTILREVGIEWSKGGLKK